jgi:hypothetical protein
MKNFLLNFVISLILALCITVYLYRPVYQNIKLGDSISDINTEIKGLNLPIKEELREILNMFLKLPFSRFQLCLKNDNRVYLIHSDSDKVFLFKTDDVSQLEDIKKIKIGAMDIELYYQEGFKKDEIYREIGQQKSCLVLDEKKLPYYASSTVSYHHISLGQTNECNLENLGKLLITRNVGNSYIDTSKSTISISPRWYLFLATLSAITTIFYPLINLIRKRLLKRSSK